MYQFVIRYTTHIKHQISTPYGYYINPRHFPPTITLRSHLNPIYAHLHLKQRPLTILRDVTFNLEEEIKIEVFQKTSESMEEKLALRGKAFNKALGGHSLILMGQCRNHKGNAYN